MESSIHQARLWKPNEFGLLGVPIGVLIAIHSLWVPDIPPIPRAVEVFLGFFVIAKAFRDDGYAEVVVGVFQCSRNSTGIWSLSECIHMVRRDIIEHFPAFVVSPALNAPILWGGYLVS